MFKLNWKYSYFVMVVFSTMMCAPNQLQAQQAPRFTQYMFNRALFNPAASGAEHDILAATFGFRQQWLKFDNGQAPQTLSFNSHASFGRGRRNVSKHDPLGAGMTVIRETLGIEERTHVNLALAYHIIQRSEVLRKNGDPELSFGMSAGLIQYQLGSAFDPKHPNDPLLIESNQNANAFDMGAGFLFENKKWEVNLSVQHLTQSTLQYNSQLSGNQSRHYFLSTAYKINGKQDSKLVLIPSFLFKYVPDAISQLDLNLRLASANNEAFLGWRELSTFGCTKCISRNQHCRLGKK